MSDLIPPHGGVSTPVDRAVPAEERRQFEGELTARPKVVVSDADLSTLYRIGDGGLSPLTGFMDRATYDRVLDEEVIVHDGKKYAWTIPLSLPASEEEAKSLKPGQAVALVNAQCKPVGGLTVSEVFPFDAARYVEKVYGTRRFDHPGGQMAQGEKRPFLVGGEVRVLPQTPHSEYGKYVLSPRQTRALFREKGWKRVVAFQTRNPLHHAHEYALVAGLERLTREGHFAGAVLNPLVGETKGDDVDAVTRMLTHEAHVPNNAMGQGDSDE